MSEVFCSTSCFQPWKPTNYMMYVDIHGPFAFFSRFVFFVSPSEQLYNTLMKTLPKPMESIYNPVGPEEFHSSYTHPFLSLKPMPITHS